MLLSDVSFHAANAPKPFSAGALPGPCLVISPYLHVSHTIFCNHLHFFKLKTVLRPDPAVGAYVAPPNPLPLSPLGRGTPLSTPSLQLQRRLHLGAFGASLLGPHYKFLATPLIPSPCPSSAILTPLERPYTPARLARR